MTELCLWRQAKQQQLCKKKICIVQLLSSRYEVYKLSRWKKECSTLVGYIRQCIKWHWHWCAPAQDMEDIVHFILTSKFTSIILHVFFVALLLMIRMCLVGCIQHTINCISKFAFNVPVTHDVCLWNGCVNRFFGPELSSQCQHKWKKTHSNNKTVCLHFQWK